MKVIIRAKAASDLAAIFAWIAKDNADAARATMLRLRKRISILEMPECVYIGCSGRAEGTRELVEGRYIIVYVVHDRRKAISIIGVFYAAQNR